MPLTDQILERYHRLFGSAGYIFEGDVGVPLALRIGVIVNMLLLLVGIVFLALTVYSGIMWITAAGNEEKITQAQARIKRAFIGFLIVAGSWALTFGILQKAAYGPAKAPGSIQIIIQ